MGCAEEEGRSIQETALAASFSVINWSRKQQEINKIKTTNTEEKGRKEGEGG